jgi:Domain of unknown function (DUF4123)
VRSREVHLTPARDLPTQVRGHGPLYALLDAAREPAVLEQITKSGEVFECLFSRGSLRELATVAPYLVQVSARSTLLDAIASAWGQSLGWLLCAHAPLAEVRRHLRRYLTIETEAGEALAFRFYDPRVLRPFLASATEDERNAFFGPMNAIFVEARAPDTLLCFEREGKEVRAPEPPFELPRIRDAQREAFVKELAAARARASA